MHVLTNNNKVFAGPNNWNVPLFQAFIQKDYGVYVELPKTAPPSGTNLGYDIVVYDVVTTKPPYNAKIEKLDGPFYTFSDIATRIYSVTDKPISQIKSELIDIVAANRYKQEIGGVNFDIQGHTVRLDTSREGRAIYLQALQSNLDNISWKFEEVLATILPDTKASKNINNEPHYITDTLWLTITTADLTNIVSTIITAIQAAFAWEQTKVNEINACTTSTELDAVELTWPAN